VSPIATAARRVGPAVLAVAIAVAGCASRAGLQPTAATRPARFDPYITPDGRVARTDQGGDTVSEGQAYAMLLAVGRGDRGQFRRVWAWTVGHLQRADGLLSYHWAGGRVVDPMPASDADLDTAWALSLAATKFSDRGYGEASRRIAAAVVDTETVSGPAGPVLVAGPWARAAPAVVNPSYFVPAAFAELRARTGDPRWDQLEASSRAVITELSGPAQDLPADWARLNPGGVQASPGPGGNPPLAYGLDAARTVVWYATSCQAADRAVAATAWIRLSGAAGAGLFPITSDLTGQPTSGLTNPLIAVADAAAAGAAGDLAASDALLVRASALDDAHATYYGSAWVALGDALLHGHLLGSCAAGPRR